MLVKVNVFPLLDIFAADGYFNIFLSTLRHNFYTKSGMLNGASVLQFFYEKGIEVPDEDYEQIRSTAKRLGVDSDILIDLLAISALICKAAFVKEQLTNTPLISYQENQLMEQDEDINNFYNKVTSSSKTQRDLVDKVQVTFTFKGKNKLVIKHPETFLNALIGAMNFSNSAVDILRELYSMFPEHDFKLNSEEDLIDKEDVITKEKSYKHLRVQITNKLTDMLLVLLGQFQVLSEKASYVIILHILSVSGIQEGIDEYYKRTKKSIKLMDRGYSTFEEAGYKKINKSYKRYLEINLRNKS